MSEATSPSAKVCIACKQDCSTRPRTKDPQGRYTCNACLEKRAATAKAKPKPASPPAPEPAMAADENQDFMASLVEQSPMAKAAACPGCTMPMLPGAVVCTSCGYNTKTGTAMKSVVRREKAPRAEREATDKRTLNLSLSPLMIFCVLGAIFGVLAVIGTTSPEMAMLYLAAVWLLSFVVGIWALVLAFMQSVVQGLLMMFLPFYALYWLLAKCESGALKACWGVSVISIVLFLVLMAHSMPTLGK